MAIKRINAGPRMSSAVVHGNTVYLAGLTADDAKADVKGQTQQILDKIDKFLKEAGTDKSKILSANIWLTDIGTWGQMNEVWDKWVSPGNTPARATVEAKLATPAYKVEIVVVAAGRPNFITGEMLRPGATVVDVGINVVDGRLVGDVDFDTAKAVVEAQRDWRSALDAEKAEAATVRSDEAARWRDSLEASAKAVVEAQRGWQACHY